MKKYLPSPELLCNILRYEPDTGRLFWLPRHLDMFPSARSCNLWNTRYAGKEAFSTIDRFGYRRGTIFNKKYKAHRIIWAMHTGKWPNLDIDHINGEPSDNRIKNLRHVSRSVNLRNAKIRIHNTTGHNGVYKHKKRGKWVAYININGTRTTLGYYDCISDAVAARAAAEINKGFTARHGT